MTRKRERERERQTHAANNIMAGRSVTGSAERACSIQTDRAQKKQRKRCENVNRYAIHGKNFSILADCNKRVKKREIPSVCHAGKVGGVSSNEFEVVVIGSGIGGLSCAAVLCWHGYSVCVLESHSRAGGAAHGFQRKGYSFETGPSFHAGLSEGSKSASPLRDVLVLI